MRGKDAVFAVIPFVCGLSFFAGIENCNVGDNFRFCFLSFKNDVSSHVFHGRLIGGSKRFLCAPVVNFLTAVQNHTGVFRLDVGKKALELAKRESQIFHGVANDV